MIQVVIVVFAILLFSGAAHAYLNATAAEIAVWQSRMTSGPYKSAGDVSSNSPGDWDRIVSSKNTFVSNPSGQRYSGKTTAGCVPAYATTPAGIDLPENNRSLGYPILSAAFYYLVNTGAGDRESVRVAVRDELLAQAAMPGADFGDSSRWCVGVLIDEPPIYNISNWLTRLLFAYDYIRPTLSGANQTTLDTWFLNAATFVTTTHGNWLRDARFPNRYSDDYSNPTDFGVGADLVVTHLNGHMTDGWMKAWSNRGIPMPRFGALVGIMLNDATLKAEGKRYFKEVIKYHTFSDNTNVEFYRWESGPDVGWGYAMIVIGPLATIADAFARSGDLELYNYSTSEGYAGTEGGPKSLGGMITLFLEHVDGTVVRYGTDNAAHNGDPDWQINTVDPILGESYIDDIGFAQANLFYRSAPNKTRYMRTAGGAVAYPSSPVTGGWGPYSGEWGIYPGVLFMFGQMEDNAANPFLTGGGGGGGGTGLSGVTNLTGKIVVSP